MVTPLDPVSAYDRIAPIFAQLSDERRAYLEAIERIVAGAVPPGSRSILDIGAGDGSRTLRIAQAAGLRDVTLLEPSAAMRSHWPPQIQTWPFRAEHLAQVQGSFDVITCLWNVLGHIFPASARAEVLSQCSRLLTPEGNLFVDVQHRYNARHYGFLPTTLRFLRDRVQPDVRNGDVTMRWAAAETSCVTSGHVFTACEFRRLCDTSGLDVERQFVIDYATGRIRRWSFEGNLLYILRRASSSVPQTSKISPSLR